MDTVAVLVALIRGVICGETISEQVKTACTPEMLERVYVLADKHDLAHLVGQALSKLDLPGSEPIQKCKQAAMIAFVRYVRLNREYMRISSTLEEAQIPFIPLKGSVLRDYYPEPWMRTSCDVDILVREEISDTAAQLLVDKLGYQYAEKTEHDISLFSPDGLHFELHFTVMEDTKVVGSQCVLDHFWDYAELCPGKAYHYQVPDELFYFYHIAHMAKHVEKGGCGMRTFLDLWILNHRMSYDQQKRDALLIQGGLHKFAVGAQALSEAWFSNMEMDESTKQFEEFILGGGVFGTLKNYISILQTKTGGKGKYTWSRIFVSREILQNYYPILEKHKWLTFAFQPVRWVHLLFKGNARRSTCELKTVAAFSKEEEKSIKQLFGYLGLQI